MPPEMHVIPNLSGASLANKDAEVALTGSPPLGIRKALSQWHSELTSNWRQCPQLQWKAASVALALTAPLTLQQ